VTSPPVTSYVSLPARIWARVLFPDPVGSHDRVHFADLDLEVDPLEDLPISHLGPEVLDVQHVASLRVCLEGYPTLPSRLTPSSFWASTANSMGSSRKTSLQKPFTIIFTGILGGDSPLPAVENLVLPDLGSGSLVLQAGGAVLHFDVGEGVRAALVPR
jgi:hypothetical protein